MGRRTKTLLPTTEALLKPVTIEPNIVQARLHKYMKDGKTHFDVNVKDLPKLELGDTVRIQDGKVWKPARVVAVHSKAPRSYMVDTPTGRVLRHNRRHLLRTREGDILNPAKAHYKAARRDDDHHIPPSPVMQSNHMNQQFQNTPELLTQNKPVTTRSGREVKVLLHVNIVLKDVKS